MIDPLKTEPIPNPNHSILPRFSYFSIRNHPIPKSPLNRLRTHQPETECWRAIPGNSPRNTPKLPTAALRAHPMGVAITAPKRPHSGQLWGRAGPFFTTPLRNFHPFSRGVRRCLLDFDGCALGSFIQNLSGKVRIALRNDTGTVTKYLLYLI